MIGLSYIKRYYKHYSPDQRMTSDISVSQILIHLCTGHNLLYKFQFYQVSFGITPILAFTFNGFSRFNCNSEKSEAISSHRHVLDVAQT